MPGIHLHIVAVQIDRVSFVEWGPKVSLRLSVWWHGLTRESIPGSF